MRRRKTDPLQERLAEFADREIPMSMDDLIDPLFFDGPRPMNWYLDRMLGSPFSYGSGRGFSSPSDIEICIMRLFAWAIGGVSQLRQRISMLETAYAPLKETGLYVGYRVHWKRFNFQLVGGPHYRLGTNLVDIMFYRFEYIEPFNLFVDRKHIFGRKLKGKPVNLVFDTVYEAVAAIIAAYPSVQAAQE